MDLRRVNWCPAPPQVFEIPESGLVPWAEVMRGIGEIGYLLPNGNCGYDGALAGLILLSKEDSMSSFSFRKKILEHLICNADRLLLNEPFRDTLEVYCNSSCVPDMKRWLLECMSCTIWNERMPMAVVTEVAWFDFELIAPIIVVAYGVSMVLYSFGPEEGSEMTVVYRNIGKGPVCDFTIESSPGIELEAAMTPCSVILALHGGHYYVVRRTNSSSFLRDRARSRGSEKPAGDSPYSHFEDDPRLALLLWYRNADLHESPIDGSLPSRTACNVRSEVSSEVVSDAEAESLLNEFASRRGQNGSHPDGLLSKGPALITCGVCGCRDPSEGHIPMKLDQLKCLEVTDGCQMRALEAERKAPPLYLPSSSSEDFRPVHVWKARNVYISDDGAFYWLYPEFVERGRPAIVQVCEKCACVINSDGIPPPHSLVCVDFGDPFKLGLEPLTVMERAMVARVRHYRSIVKIRIECKALQKSLDFSRDRLRSHCILFPHDAPRVVPMGMLLSHMKERVNRSISLQFVGPKGEIDRLTMETFRRHDTMVFGRWQVVYSWLMVLHAVNPLYEGDFVPSMREVKEFVQSCNNAVQEAALCLDDGGERETIETDDVAGIRSSGGVCAPPGEGGVRVMSFSMIREGNMSREPGGAVYDTLRSAATAFGIDCRQNAISTRSDIPINEFQNNEYGLVGAFPDVFLYGRAYGHEVAGLSLLEREHLLLHYSGLAANCRELICYLFDQLQRHSTIGAVSATVRGTCKAYQRFSSLAASTDFELRLKSALRDCFYSTRGRNVVLSEDARSILRDILPVLSLPPHQVGFNYVFTNNSVGKMFALVQRYGPASVFLTISPDDVNDPTSFRMTFRSVDNFSFPAVVSGDFFQAMRNASKFKCSSTYMIPREVDCSRKSRCVAAEANPVAAAVGFYRLIYDIMSVLVRCPYFRCKGQDRHRDRRTKYYRDCGKGVFGYCRAFFGVVEAQGRGSLHYHVLIWGGLSASLLESTAHCPETRTEVAKAMNQMYAAELPRHLHAKDLTMRELRLEGEEVGGDIQYCPSLSVAPSPLTAHDKHREDCHSCVRYSGIHNHRLACHDGRHGEDGCRFNAPWGTEQETRPVQLLTSADGNVVASNVIQSPDSETSIDEVLPPPERRLIRWELRRRALEELPLRAPSDSVAACAHRLFEAMEGSIDSSTLDRLCSLDPPRLFALYDRVSLKLSTRNEWVVPYCPLLTSAIRCHSAAIPLGGATESRLAGLYLFPYLNKNKQRLIHILSLAYQSLVDIGRFPSMRHVIGESDNERRSIDIQHFVTRLLNKLNVLTEVSDVQAASALLGYRVTSTSELFVPYRAREAVNFVRFLCNGHDIDDIPCIVDCSQDESLGTETEDYVQVDTFGPSEVVPSESGKQIIMSQPWQYEYRGSVFADYSRIEYASLVCIQKKTLKRPHPGAGRPYLRRYELDRRCPLFATHEQKIFAVQKTPVVYGEAPCLPGPRPAVTDPAYPNWLARANVFAEYYLVAHRPEPILGRKPRYDWKAFKRFVTSLQQSRDSVDQLRYAGLLRSIYKESTSPGMREALTKYRARHRTLWKERSPSRRSASGSSGIEELMKAYLMQWESENLSSGQVRKAWLMCDYVVAQRNAVSMISQTITGSHRQSVIPVLSCNLSAAHGVTSELVSHAHLTDLKTNESNVMNPISSDGGAGSQFDRFLMDIVRKRSLILSVDQIEILRYLHRQFYGCRVGDTVGAPALLLVTGSPGTGKSLVIRMLRYMIEICGFGHSVTTAYAGIAASHVGGQTICSLFQIPFGENEERDLGEVRMSDFVRPLNPVSLQALRDTMRVDTLRCLIIDEASMVTPQILWIINARLRQLTGYDIAFGGISVVLVSVLANMPAWPCRFPGSTYVIAIHLSFMQVSCRCLLLFLHPVW